MFKPALVKCSIVFVIAVVLLLIYLPGATGSLYYDDYSNLRSLSSIADGDSFNFVFSGTAGPTGRPVALVSFLPHAASWPHNSDAILRVNVVIHVLNFLLLVLLGWQILRVQSGVDKKSVFIIALLSAAMWAVLPINVSTSLIAIQRMTGLSALFGLIGLNCFVAGYRLKRPLQATIFQMGSLGLCSIVALYTKENGATIPLYALLIDQLFFKNSQKSTIYSLIRVGSLYSLLIMLLIYLSPLMRNWTSFSDFRGFSALERVQTEWVILWSYLKAALLPLPTSFSPFHDEVEIVKDNVLIAVAGAVWFVAIATSIALRKKTIMPLFALLWFLTGHLLESSSVTLELYFEHRNYLPLYGLCFALTCAAWGPSNQFSGALRVSYLLYILLIASVCYMTTSFWGRPLDAAVTWATDNPGSTRAAQHLTVSLNKMVSANSTSEESRQQRQTSLYYLDRNTAVCSKCIGVQIQSLLYSCTIENNDQIQQRYDTFLGNAKSGRPSMSVIDGLFSLIELVKANHCGGIHQNDVLVLITRLLENPAFNRKTFMVRLRFLAANAAYEAGDLELANKHLAYAETQEPAGMPVLQFQIYIALLSNNYEGANAAIERRRKYVGKDNQITTEMLDSLCVEVESAQLPVN